VKREAWDTKYSGSEFLWKEEPNRFLVSELKGLAPGRALDLACGEGRNAVWLAQQGWSVTGVDFSEVGLAKAAQLAERRGVEVEWVAADLLDYIPPAGLDLVIAFYFQVSDDERHLVLGRAAEALAPGGTVLVVAHDLLNLSEGIGGPSDPEVLYTPEDVVADLAGLVIERAERVTRPVGEGTAIDALVRASKPA
jgi:SAM-dependent methyltransferase